MRELIIERRKLYERSKAMRDLTFFYKRDSLDRKRKEQDKVYK